MNENHFAYREKSPNSYQIRAELIKPPVENFKGILDFKSVNQEINDRQFPGILVFDSVEIREQEYLLSAKRAENITPITIQSASINSVYILECLRELAEILDNIHAANIVHGLITPHSVMIEQRKKIIRDWGIFYLLDIPKIVQSDHYPKIEHYLAPEIRRQSFTKLSPAMDMYSLGALAVGVLCNALEMPYNTVPLEFLQKTEFKDYPEGLIQILSKLVEPDARNRYTNATELLSDLNRFLKGGDPGSQKTHSSPAQGTAKKSILIGRSAELKTLSGINRILDTGKGRLVGICGLAGSGKTALIEEFQRLTGPERLVLKGRSYPNLTQQPYQPFKKILRDYSQIFQSYPEYSKTKLRDALKDLAGINFGIINQIFPECSMLFPETRTEEELSIQSESVGISTFISRIIKEIALFEQSLIIIIEDIQWGDKESIDLLSRISLNIEHCPVLMLFSYRKEDILRNASLTETLQNPLFRADLIQIELSMLSFKETKTLIETKMPNESGINYQHIYDLTHGNPLFIKEVLLHNQSNLEENGYGQNIKITSPIIEDLLLTRLKYFNKLEIEILQCLSLVEEGFPIALIDKFVLQYNETTSGLLEKTVNYQVLHMIDKEKMLFAFTHDKIQKKLRLEIKQDLRISTHDTLALFYLESGNQIGSDGDLFQAAFHSINGNGAVLNLSLLERASDYGMTLLNYAVVRSFLEKALSIPYVKKKPEIRQSLLYKIGICETMMGSFKEAYLAFVECIRLTKDEMEQCRILQRMALCLFRNGKYSECEETANEIFKIIGISFPISKPRLYISLAHMILQSLRPYLMQKHISLHTTQKMEIAMETAIILSWVYVYTDRIKFLHATLLMKTISSKYLQNSQFEVIAYCGLAGILMSLPLFNAAGKMCRKAMEIAEICKTRRAMAYVHQITGYLRIWEGKYNDAVTHLEQASNLYLHQTEMKQYQICQEGLQQSHWLTGNMLDFHKSYTNLRNNAVLSNDHFSQTNNKCTWAEYLYEIGKWPETQLILNEIEEHYKIIPYDIHIITARIIRGKIALQRKEYQNAFQEGIKCEKINTKANLLKQYINHIWILKAKSLIGLSETEARGKVVKAVRTALRKCRLWPAFKGEALTTSAQYYYKRKKYKKADRRFQQGINHQKQYGLRLQLCRSYFLYAEYLEERFHIEKARFYRLKGEALLRESGSGTSFTEEVFQNRNNYTGQNSPEKILINSITSVTGTASLAHCLSELKSGIQLMTAAVACSLELKIGEWEFSYSFPENHHWSSVKKTIIDNMKNNETTADLSKEEPAGPKKGLDIRGYGVPIRIGGIVSGLCYLEIREYDKHIFNRSSQSFNLFLNQAALHLHVLAEHAEPVENPNPKISNN